MSASRISLHDAALVHDCGTPKVEKYSDLYWAAVNNRGSGVASWVCPTCEAVFTFADASLGPYWHRRTNGSRRWLKRRRKETEPAKATVAPEPSR